MSDKNIRQGLRDLQALGPEYASQLVDRQKIQELISFFVNAKRFEEHARGLCRHCNPRSHKGETPISGAIITPEGVVISSSCKTDYVAGSVGHDWCSNRNWTETNCGCECHCFVKRFYQKSGE